MRGGAILADFAHSARSSRASRAPRVYAALFDENASGNIYFETMEIPIGVKFCIWFLDILIEDNKIFLCATRNGSIYNRSYSR